MPSERKRKEEKEEINARARETKKDGEGDVEGHKMVFVDTKFGVIHVGKRCVGGVGGVGKGVVDRKVIFLETRQGIRTVYSKRRDKVQCPKKLR